MPKGSTAYTFRCVVPGMQVTDESPAAARFAAECGLKHEIIDIYWEDFEALTPSADAAQGHARSLHRSADLQGGHARPRRWL